MSPFRNPSSRQSKSAVPSVYLLAQPFHTSPFLSMSPSHSFSSPPCSLELESNSEYSSHCFAQCFYPSSPTQNCRQPSFGLLLRPQSLFAGCFLGWFARCLFQLVDCWSAGPFVLNTWDSMNLTFSPGCSLTLLGPSQPAASKTQLLTSCRCRCRSYLLCPLHPSVSARPPSTTAPSPYWFCQFHRAKRFLSAAISSYLSQPASSVYMTYHHSLASCSKHLFLFLRFEFALWKLFVDLRFSEMNFSWGSFLCFRSLTGRCRRWCRWSLWIGLHCGQGRSRHFRLAFWFWDRLWNCK